MNETNQSDVERFYAAIQAKFGGSRIWSMLAPEEQVQFCHGLNLILSIVMR
jgi:hypothetical protein